MIAYVFGAGASVNARYPLASSLLHELSNWLDSQNIHEYHIEKYRNRFVQLRALFPTLDDFEEILRILSNGQDQVKLECDTPRGETNAQSNRFCLQYLRDDLVSAVREFFYYVEEHRSEETAYDKFAQHHMSQEDTLITFNYDVSLERALKRAGTWDIGSGYGFPLFANRPMSPLTLFKLHGSVNWFQGPMQNAPPPLMFPRDIELLGYQDVGDPRIGAGVTAVDNTGTVILPDTNKQFCWKGLWQPLWTSAAERLCGVQELFILGYSMPCADARARRLLFDNVSPGASIHIYCMDASERIADDFRKVGFTNVRPESKVTFELWAAERPTGSHHS